MSLNDGWLLILKRVICQVCDEPVRYSEIFPLEFLRLQVLHKGLALDCFHALVDEARVFLLLLLNLRFRLGRLLLLRLLLLLNLLCQHIRVRIKHTC